MNLKTCGQFEDAVLMAMVISALESGVRTLGRSEEVYRVTAMSLQRWVRINGKPGWNGLKKLYPQTAPKEKKKRKAAAKTGEKQTKKKKWSGCKTRKNRKRTCVTTRPDRKRTVV
jgi:hypothetical protein